MRRHALLAAVLLLALGPAAARADDASLDLRVLSYNVWGIPYVTPEWAHRAPEIGRAIAALAPDVVGLQEVWQRSDADTIAAAAGLPHHVYFDAPGRAGLLILSRWPIDDPRLDVFPLNGNLHFLAGLHTDWLAGKGVATARIRTPAGPLPFLDTHLISRNSDLPLGIATARRLSAHRLTQIHRVLGALEHVRAGAALPALLTGDFNARLGSPEMDLLLGAGRVRVASAARIDFVLAGDAPGHDVTVRKTAIAPSGTIPGANGVTTVPLSDHDGVVADLTLRRVDASVVSSTAGAIERAVAAASAADLMDAMTAEVTRDRIFSAVAMLGAIAALGGLWLLVRRRGAAAPRSFRIAVRFTLVALLAFGAHEVWYAVLAGPREARLLRETAAAIRASAGAGTAGAAAQR
jgi:endonuclease/exonuclease/phosphatase family metal-dependent hydrolase